MTGYDDMPKVVASATGDIRHHLWSLYWVARLLDAKSIVELGVRSGDSTRALLAAARDLGGKVVSYDRAGDAYRVADVTRRHGIPWVEGFWECRQSDSVEAGRAWPEGPVDLVFIDTLHTFEHTLAELYAWAPHVRSGGVIALHDTGNQDPSQNGVRPALDAFLSDGLWHNEWRLEDHPFIAEGDVGMGFLWRK